MSIFFSISAFLKCSKDKRTTNRPDLSISGSAVQFDLKFDLLEPFECNLINLGVFCGRQYLILYFFGFVPVADHKSYLNSLLVGPDNFKACLSPSTMTSLFNFGASKTTQPNMSIDLRLEQPEKTKWATFVAAA